MIGVYKITCAANGKRYVGSSVDVSGRIKLHKSALLKGSHRNQHLQRAWNKYGDTAFAFETLLECDLDAVRIWEKRIIDNVKPEFNCRGTDPLKDLSGHSAETIAKISAASRSGSPAIRSKISATLMGHSVSEETRAKLSAANRRRWADPNERLKQAERAKLSVAKKGHKVSSETRAKLSAATKNWYRRRAVRDEPYEQIKAA